MAAFLYEQRPEYRCGVNGYVMEREHAWWWKPKRNERENSIHDLIRINDKLYEMKKRFTEKICNLKDNCA